MRGTFTLPDGKRLRSASQRRYIVARWSDYPTPAAGRWIIAYRTDALARAIGRALPAGVRAVHADHVIDTETGETVR